MVILKFAKIETNWVSKLGVVEVKASEINENMAQTIINILPKSSHL